MTDGFFSTLYSITHDTILSVTPASFGIGACVLLALCLYSCWRVYNWIHHVRLVENTPTSTIRAAVQGYVELVGHAKRMHGPRTISASGAECVWYRYKAIEFDGGYDRLWWHWGLTIIINAIRSIFSFSNTYFSPNTYTTSDDLFLLEDETGQCIVDPDYADVIATHKKVWRNRSSSGTLVKYIEYRIDEGDALYVSGLFETHGHTTPDYEKEALSDLLRKWKQDPVLLAKFDKNNDGDIDVEEWEAVRLAAMREVKREHIQPEKQQLLNLLRSSRKKNQPFILSGKSESSLVFRYYWRALIALTLFISSGSFLIWAINLRQGL